MRKYIVALLMFVTTVAFGQSDTTDLNTLINSNFPDNTSNFITPTRLRTVAKELMRSSANLLERNAFAERQTFEDAVIGEDSIKSDVGFYVWNGVAYEEIVGGGDTANWSISGGFISPIDFTNKLNVDTARFAGNLYPNGTVNIGRSGAKFDTVFANVFDGLGGSKWELSGDSLYPYSSIEYFAVETVDADTTTSILLTTFNGRRYAAMITDSASVSVSTNGQFSLVAMNNGYIFVSDTLDVKTQFVKISDTLSARVIDKSYGEMGFRDSSYTIALDVDVPAWATNVGNDLWEQAAQQMRDFTYDGDSLVVNRDGIYAVHGHLSVSGSNGDVLRAMVYKNGVSLCDCAPVESLVNNRIIPMAFGTDISALEEGDVLKIYIENIGTSNDVAAISGKLTLYRID